MTHPNASEPQEAQEQGKLKIVTMIPSGIMTLKITQLAKRNCRIQY